MKPDIYETPFEDEELEARAHEHFEQARDEGSLLSDEDLMRECRQLAQENVERIRATEDEPVPLNEDEV